MFRDSPISFSLFVLGYTVITFIEKSTCSPKMCSSQTSSLPWDEASYKQLELFICYGILDYKEHFNMADRLASDLEEFYFLGCFLLNLNFFSPSSLVITRLVRAFLGGSVRTVQGYPRLCSTCSCSIWL